MSALVINSRTAISLIVTTHTSNSKFPDYAIDRKDHLNGCIRRGFRNEKIDYIQRNCDRFNNVGDSGVFAESGDIYRHYNELRLGTKHSHYDEHIHPEYQ